MRTSSAPLLGRSGTGVATWCLLAVAAVALVIGLLAPAQQLARSGGSVPVTLAHPHSAHVLDQPGLPAGTHLITDADSVELQADTLPAGLRLLSQLPTSLAAFSIAAGAWWLARVLRTIRAGQPFDRRNPTRLAAVAAAVLVGAELAPVLGDTIGNLVIDHLGLADPGSPVAMGVRFSFAPLLIAVLLMAAAEAFRRGAALDRDVTGLV